VNQNAQWQSLRVVDPQTHEERQCSLGGWVETRVTCELTLSPMLSHAWACSRITLRMYGLTLSPMLSHAWAFSRNNLFFHLWIDSLTYALGHISLFTHESTFSRMNWITQLCFLMHEPFHLWMCLLTYRLTLSQLLSHAWAFSPMNLLSHVCIDFLTYAFSRMSLFTYLLMIAFITLNSSLVYLLEGLWSSNPYRFGFSILGCLLESTRWTQDLQYHAEATWALNI